jgi:DNA repair exonuclease SbcCD ATPase subunit
MGYQTGHRGPRRSHGQRFQKSQHEKAKNRAHKHRLKGTFSEEETTVTAEMAAEKATSNLKRLGEQKFAVSPFRQYFDDWLLNVKQTLSEFETSRAVAVDGEFVKTREQTLAKVESELAAVKREEEALEPCVKELADTNHLLVELDADYSAKTRETGTRRNTEIQRLTKKIHDLEEELEEVKAMKTRLFGGFTKKAKTLKIAEISSKLDAAKPELEKTVETFKLEQDKLHDGYEKKKQEAMAKVQALEKEIEKLDEDKSHKARREASETLAEAVKTLLERQPKPPSEPAG